MTPSLASLVRLLDDRSEVVRDSVDLALLDHGRGLFEEARRLDDGGSAAKALADRSRHVWKARLMGLIEAAHFSPGAEWDTFEEWLGCLSAIIDPTVAPGGDRQLRAHLDALAESFREFAADSGEDEGRSVAAMARYLFGGQGLFHGDSGGYYKPRNSSLVSVCERRQGNPVSLALVLMGLARRCGREVGGCNYPGHFLALHRGADGSTQLYDCFNSGTVFSAGDLVENHPLSSPDLSDLVETPASYLSIWRRILRNLVRGLTRQEEGQAADAGETKPDLDLERLVRGLLDATPEGDRE